VFWLLISQNAKRVQTYGTLLFYSYSSFDCIGYPLEMEMMRTPQKLNVKKQQQQQKIHKKKRQKRNQSQAHI
jgi:hypothetical protein